MAFNDVRIQGNREKQQTFENNMVPQKTPQRNNLVNMTQSKDRALKPIDSDLKVDEKFEHLLSQLDFDKMVKKREDSNREKVEPATGHDISAKIDGAYQKDVDDLFDVDHPLDLSFT